MDELNRQIAERLGYSVYHYDKDYAENCYYQLVDESFTPVVYAPYYATGQRKTEAEAWADVPDFAGGEAVRFVEDEIDRRGLGARYTQRLALVVFGDEYDFSLFEEGGHLEPYDGWRLIRATPEQRCRAALEVLKVTP